MSIFKKLFFKEAYFESKHKKRRNLNDLVGKVKFRDDYDYKSMRNGR